MQGTDDDVTRDAHSSHEDDDDAHGDDNADSTPLARGRAAGQVVYMRRSGVGLCFVDVVGEDGVRIELVVKAARVPKLVKLGDVVEAEGEWEDAATLRTTSVPRVVIKFDNSRPFVPIPDASRRPKAVALPTEPCRFWLSSRACMRGASCRYLHSQLDSEEYLVASRSRLAKLEESRSQAAYDQDDPFRGRKQRKSHRPALFAAWLLETFGPVHTILDVAGGGGALSRALLEAGAARRVLLVDPRAETAGVSATLPDPEGLVRRAALFTADFEAGETVDLVVGMHIDQATDCAMQYAADRGLPFAVVPCCVFADELPRDGTVRTYEQLLAYLCRTFAAHKSFLPMQGRNVVLHSRKIVY